MILGFLPPAIQLKSSRHENVPNFILTQFKLYKENWFSDKIKVNGVKVFFKNFVITFWENTQQTGHFIRLLTSWEEGLEAELCDIRW